MENIYIVLTLFALLLVCVICQSDENEIQENFIIQNESSTTDQLNPKDYLLYLPENELHNPIIPAAKNITNDIYGPAYTTFDLSHSVKPKYRFHPENKHQVSFILNKKKFGTNIRVSGSNNTFNDISITRDTIIRTNRFNNILNINETNKQVTVESGVLLKDLNESLLNKGLSLPVIPECMDHSVGGAISTGVHGTCIHNGSLSSYLINITMVLPTGKIKTFTKKDNEFKALTTGLGCLGFIYSVTLQCVNPFVVRHEEIRSTWHEVLPNLKLYLESNPLLQIYILDPYDTNLPCVLFLRKGMNVDKENPTFENYVATDYNNVFEFTQNGRNIRIGEGSKIIGRDIDGEYTEQEIGVPLKHLKDSIQNVITYIREAKKKYDLVSKYPVIIRFSGKDTNSYLSASSKINTTAWISIFNDAKDVQKDCLTEMSNEIEDRLILKYKGRPNYSKRNHLNEEKMSWLYGHCYRDFQYVRNSMDSERLFTNEYIKRVIGE